MNQPIIELEGLTKKYGSFTAVDQLSLRISPGEIFGLLGPNGAGKSTTILMMIGLTEPSAGRVRVCGIDSTHNPAVVKRQVGYLPEDVGFYQELTGMENLVYTARLNGMSREAAQVQAAQVLGKVGLAEHGHKKTATYSRGMRQRLGLADVLIKSPRVIILDEPTLGLDPEGVRELLNLIVKLSRVEGLTVLLSSHHLHQVQQICDRVGIFVGGKLIAEGDIQKLSSQLFSGEPFIVEARVMERDGTTGQLKTRLEQLDGVKAVHGENGRLEISCSADLTSEIARTILQSGLDLLGLQRKEYGLDDIYHRYFEGGKDKLQGGRKK